MAQDTAYGFWFVRRESGGLPSYQTFVVADTAFHEGDTVELESDGEVDLGAAGDSNFIGVVSETLSGLTAGTSIIEVITDPDAIYSVYDPNARTVGATLDISGATGAQTVTTSSGKEFVVVETSTATERTRVRFNIGKHHKNKAQ